MENAGVSAASRYPGMLTPGASRGPSSAGPALSAGGPPPQFTVFKPAPVPAKEEEKEE